MKEPFKYQPKEYQDTWRNCFIAMAQIEMLHAHGKETGPFGEEVPVYWNSPSEEVLSNAYIHADVMCDFLKREGRLP